MRHEHRTVRSALVLVIFAGALGARCATPIEIPLGDAGAIRGDSAPWSPTSDGGIAWDAAASAPDAFSFGDAFDSTAITDGELALAESVALPGVTALYADGDGLYVAAGTALWHWAPGAPALAAHSTAPAAIHQIAGAGAGTPRLYLATDVGVLSVARSGGGAPQTHHAPAAGGTFWGGVAVSATQLFVVDATARQVLSAGVVGPGSPPSLPQVRYDSPYQQATTLSTAIAARGDSAYFADYDGPLALDGAGAARRLGGARTSYRWSGVVPTADALYVAQAGDFTEGLMRIALPGGGETGLIWIGGANNNAGLEGPLLFGGRLVWSAASGVYRTDVETRATVRLARFGARLAGDGAQTLYLAPLADAKVYRTTLAP
jgi:hypothetical protein